MRTLDQIPINQRATVIALRGGGRIRARLMDMGFVHGTEVKMIRRAPMGGPFEVSIMGSNISLRPEEARMVVVKSDHPGGGRRGPHRRRKPGRRQSGRGFFRGIFDPDDE